MGFTIVGLGSAYFCQILLATIEELRDRVEPGSRDRRAARRRAGSLAGFELTRACSRLLVPVHYRQLGLLSLRALRQPLVGTRGRRHPRRCILCVAVFGIQIP